jgi:hypothetical protein
LKEIAPALNLSRSARALLAVSDSPRAFLDRLRAQELDTDAVLVLPHLLPKRLAVWWGCLCAWSVARAGGDNAPAGGRAQLRALRAAVRWVREPSEANRQLAVDRGQKVGMNTPAGCLALAAGWSGGSLSLPHLPVVPPPPELTARLVGAAVLLCAVVREPMQYQGRCRQFLLIGEDVAAGRLPCDPTGAQRPAAAACTPERADRPRQRPHRTALGEPRPALELMGERGV